MKKAFIGVIAIMASVCASAQQGKPQEDGFKFETVKQLPITSIKNQASTGTCWCFSVMSFIESEIMRQGYKGDELDLSEMFVVSNSYADKAVKYIRLDGHLNYDEGSSFGDVLTTIKEHGIVPDSVMPGLNYGTKSHLHAEMVAGLKGFLGGIVKNPNGKLTPSWKPALDGILASYLGAVPETFEVNGKQYTPQSYLESLPFNPDDYVQLSSWTHIPYYKLHPLESADGWRWEEAYNLPIDDFMQVLFNSIDKGYTFVWGTDVSEVGFTRDGVGFVPDLEAVETAGSDQAHWVGSQPNGRKTFNGPVKELTITPEMRQTAYENKSTTEDHGMHVFGLAKDVNGTNYFMVKNSWGESGKYKGIWYASENYLKYKTIAVLVHKDAIPAAIKAKLGL